MSLWSSVPCQAVLLSLSRLERSQDVLCVDCNETCDAALLPVVRGPLLLCRTLTVTVCLQLVVVFCTAFPSAFALGSFQCLQWEFCQSSSARYSARVFALLKQVLHRFHGVLRLSIRLSIGRRRCHVLELPCVCEDGEL